MCFALPQSYGLQADFEVCLLVQTFSSVRRVLKIKTENFQNSQRTQSVILHSFLPLLDKVYHDVVKLCVSIAPPLTVLSFLSALPLCVCVIVLQSFAPRTVSLFPSFLDFPSVPGEEEEPPVLEVLATLTTPVTLYLNENNDVNTLTGVMFDAEEDIIGRNNWEVSTWFSKSPDGSGPKTNLNDESLLENQKHLPIDPNEPLWFPVSILFLVLSKLLNVI